MNERDRLSEPTVELLGGLPSALRQSVADYLELVALQAATIFDDAGLTMTREARQRFLFAVAVRKIYRTVSSQYWTMRSTVSMLEQYGLREASVGGARYSRQSEDYREVQRLWRELDAQVRDLDLSDHVAAESLAELAVASQR